MAGCPVPSSTGVHRRVTEEAVTVVTFRSVTAAGRAATAGSPGVAVAVEATDPMPGPSARAM